MPVNDAINTLRIQHHEFLRDRLIIELDLVEPELEFAFDDTGLIEAGSVERDQIVGAFLTDAIATQFPGAQRVSGDRLASVATGLGIHAQRLFAPVQLRQH